MSWNSMSGAGDSETPSVSTSRKRASADREIRRRGERLRCTASTSAGIVGREDAEAIADLVVEAAVGEIELDMPGFLFRARLC